MNRESKAKHTQGKWSVADYGHCIAVEVKLDNGQEHTIMTDQLCHAAKFNGDAMANARIIAASPELLEALKGLLSWSAHLPFAADDKVEFARDIIKKIEQ